MPQVTARWYLTLSTWQQSSRSRCQVKYFQRNSKDIQDFTLLNYTSEKDPLDVLQYYYKPQNVTPIQVSFNFD
jgi:hypothetical protein